MEETKTEEILIPAGMYDELKKHGNPDELAIKAAEKLIKEINKKEDEEPFLPNQIVATEDVDEVIKQNWIHCLPRPAEFCNVKIVGNSLIVTPVKIEEIQ